MNPREAALAALERCRRDGAWSGAAIDTAIKKYALDRRDAALASRLCLGVLQNSRLLDFYINSYSSIPADKLEEKVRDILRLGIYQLTMLDKIPARAAVNESVALCKSCGCGRASGLVNAVLRKIASCSGSLPPVPGEGSAEYLSIKYSHPRWIGEKITKQQGYAFAEQFLAANNCPAPLDLQVNTLKTGKEDIVRSLLRLEMEFSLPEYPENCLSLKGGNVSALPGFEEGLFYVQDRAAAMAVQILGLKPGMQVLDACAAPGGKSFAAAIAMENKGSILSCDIHEKKLPLIQRGAERLGLDIIRTRRADAREPLPELASRFDAVIADVPCSGLGVIRKKPEIREKTEEETARLPRIQQDILDNLSRCVKPGGLLLYSTCTVLREENQDVVNGFLSRHSAFEPVDFAVGSKRSEQGMYTFWPNTDNTDGFFAAKLRRKV